MSSDKPNILFILADQHNAKVLGHAGHANVKTPNLDRLAAAGVRFENAIVQNPICTPSRTCFLSGQYCHNHGYYGLSGPNPNGLPSIFSHFRQHGYRTGAAGKIHCPEYWVEDATDMFHETCDCSIGGRSRAYLDFLGDREDLEDHLAMRDLGPAGEQSMEGRPSPLSYEESQEGWIASTVITFMEQAVADGKPFLVQASLPRPHQCTAPSEPFWSMYDGVDLELPPSVDNDPVAANKPPHFIKTVNAWRRGDWALLEPRTHEAARLRKLQGYLGAVSQVDHAVGQMVDFLDANGLAENTIVIYVSDHGDYACEHDIMEKAPGICSDAITRVPFIWRWPGQFAAGHTAAEIVESVDLSNTLCRLAQVPVMETSDGQDISHLLHGETGEVHKVGVTEFAFSKSVRKGKWRYVHYPPDIFPEEHPQGFGELYDLEADPWEMSNLYGKKEHADTVRELQLDLVNWLITTTRPRTTHGADATAADNAETHSQRRWRNHSIINADNKIHPDLIRDVTWKNYI
jgi:choline-sulfatase/uncharacterized sulfatase